MMSFDAAVMRPWGLKKAKSADPSMSEISVFVLLLL